MNWWLGLFEPFALKPAGTGRWVAFWMASISGFVFAIWHRRMFGLMLITVPISAALLATLRIVPPNERLGLWIVPALYASVAMAGDAPVWLARRYSNRAAIADVLAGAVCLGAMVTLVCADIFRRGQLELAAKPMSNYGLDDRSSVRAAPGAPSSWRRRHDDAFRLGGPVVVQRVEYCRSRRRQPASGRQSDFRDRARRSTFGVRALA